MLSDDVVPPTPSPLFPRNIANLFAMSPNDARQLVLDYGLVNNKDKGDSPGQSLAKEKLPESPADAQDIHGNLNRFMAHIGVGYSKHLGVLIN